MILRLMCWPNQQDATSAASLITWPPTAPTRDREDPQANPFRKSPSIKSSRFHHPPSCITTTTQTTYILSNKTQIQPDRTGHRPWILPKTLSHRQNLIPSNQKCSIRTSLRMKAQRKFTFGYEKLSVEPSLEHLSLQELSVDCGQEFIWEWRLWKCYWQQVHTSWLQAAKKTLLWG